MKHLSLFSGIGGFDLAAEWMGWQNLASCEINEFCNKVLEYYYPNAYHHRDSEATGEMTTSSLQVDSLVSPLVQQDKENE